MKQQQVAPRSENAGACLDLLICFAFGGVMWDSSCRQPGGGGAGCCLTGTEGWKEKEAGIGNKWHNLAG